MIGTGTGRSRSKGHPRGGLFLACLLLAGCGPTTSNPDLSPEYEPPPDLLPDPLAVYQGLGFLTGNPRFAAVGRFVFAPGPGDSTYAILALSLPNDALRFRREETGLVASYRVDIEVGDSTAPVARLQRIEEVRVRTFRETSRRDESVVFQGFLTLPAGRYPARVRVGDAAVADGLFAELELEVPRFAGPSVTAPILVYRAGGRADRATPPSFILSPRATIELDRPAPQIYVESVPDGEHAVIIEALSEGEVIWADTLAPPDTAAPPAGTTLRSGVLPIDASNLPPGLLSLRTRLEGVDAADSTTALVSLNTQWLARSYDEALDYLRYAGTLEQLDSLREAAPRERAQRFHAFWNRRDPDPATPENEFFVGYFRRIQEANARFSEPATPGWLSDRGAVYVTLGPPDEVLRDLYARQGAERSLVWLYEKSLGFELRLVFTDPSGTGVFTLSGESRRALAEAVRSIYS